jgi:Spy/CpxP family protein refolding chaperone
MHKIREEEQQKIHAILSPEQQTQWDALQKERAANRAKKRGPGPAF